MLPPAKLTLLPTILHTIIFAVFIIIFPVTTPHTRSACHCTREELFESHHPNIEKARSLLKKYQLKLSSSLPPRNSGTFSFKTGGFYDTLRTRAWRGVLQYSGTGPTWAMLVFHTTLLLLFLTLLFSASAIAGQSDPMSDKVTWLGTASMAGVVLALLMMCSHNFFHQKDNWRMYVFDLSPFSSYDWRITHAYSHHVSCRSLFNCTVVWLLLTNFLSPDISKHEFWLWGLHHSQHFKFLSVWFSKLEVCDKWRKWNSCRCQACNSNHSLTGNISLGNEPCSKFMNNIVKWNAWLVFYLSLDCFSYSFWGKLRCFCRVDLQFVVKTFYRFYCTLASSCAILCHLLGHKLPPVGRRRAMTSSIHAGVCIKVLLWKRHWLRCWLFRRTFLYLAMLSRAGHLWQFHLVCFHLYLFWVCLILFNSYSHWSSSPWLLARRRCISYFCSQEGHSPGWYFVQYSRKQKKEIGDWLGPLSG